MPKPAKIDCSFKKLGDHGAMLKIHTHADGFGKMKADVHWELDSDRMTEIVVTNGEQIARRLNGMEIDGSDESIGEYVMALGTGLSKLMADLKEAIVSGG